MNINRQPAGQPTGGQFAEGARASAGIALTRQDDLDIPEVEVMVEYKAYEDERSDSSVHFATHAFDLGPYIAETPVEDRFTEFGDLSGPGDLDYWVEEAMRRGDLPVPDGVKNFHYDAHSSDLEDLSRIGEWEAIPSKREPKVIPGVPLGEPLSREDALAEADANGFLTATVSVSQTDFLDNVRIGAQSGATDEHEYLASKVSPFLPHDSSYEIAGVGEEGGILVNFTTNVQSASAMGDTWLEDTAA